MSLREHIAQFRERKRRAREQALAEMTIEESPAAAETDPLPPPMGDIEDELPAPPE